MSHPHATVAGVLLGFAVPIMHSQVGGGPDAGPGLAEAFEYRFRPISAGFAVPACAFFPAGRAVGGRGGLTTDLPAPVAVGIIARRVLGEPIGIVGATWSATEITPPAGPVVPADPSAGFPATADASDCVAPAGYAPPPCT